MNFSLELLKLLLKYGISKYNCEKRSKEQIKELYLKNYPDKKEEMEWMIKHKSRTADSIAFSSLTICAANKGREKKDSQETREIVGWQINIAKVASAMDDLHDEFLVPYLVEKYERGINKEVYTSNIIELIENYERMYDFALKQKPKYLKNKQVIPSVIAGSCLRVEKAYRASLEASNPDTLKVYIEGKEGVQRFQAKDIAISVALKKNDLEGVLEIIGNGEYIKKLSELHDKLGIIGGKDCVIVNQLSWEKRNIEMEEVNQALQEFFTPLTKLNQAGVDDGKKILEDISSKSPNIFMLSTLPSTLDTSLKAVKKFMRKNPKTVSEILTPLIESTFYGLKRLKSLNFAYEDCKVGFNWSMKRIRSSMDYFENIIGVDMDKEWWRKYKELKNHL